MEQVFSYIIALGVSVMMPIIFTIVGMYIGMKFGEALKSGLFVGVGFVGLGVVTAFLITNFDTPLKAISDLHRLQLNILDTGWPAAAAVACNTVVSVFVIPIYLGVNFLILIIKTTRTVNTDLQDYWYFTFIDAVAYFVTDRNSAWGYFAAIICYIITLVCADLTAEKFQKFYDSDGISIPQPFRQSFTLFAILINRALDKIPGFSKLEIGVEGMEKRSGVIGGPLVLGAIVGMLIGWAIQFDTKKMLLSGIIMGTVMELIPRITSLFIEGLKPIFEKTSGPIKAEFNGKKVHTGMNLASVIGYPTALVASVILVPVILALVVFLPGNQFLLLASPAGMPHLFPIILPFTKSSVVRTLTIGLVILILGLYFITDTAPGFILTANQIYVETHDPTAHTLGGFDGGSIDFVASFFGWTTYRGVKFSYIGVALPTLITIATMLINRRIIVRSEKEAQESSK